MYVRRLNGWPCVKHIPLNRFMSLMLRGAGSSLLSCYPYYVPTTICVSDSRLFENYSVLFEDSKTKKKECCNNLILRFEQWTNMLVAWWSWGKWRNQKETSQTKYWKAKNTWDSIPHFTWHTSCFILIECRVSNLFYSCHSLCACHFVIRGEDIHTCRDRWVFVMIELRAVFLFRKHWTPAVVSNKGTTDRLMSL